MQYNSIVDEMESRDSSLVCSISCSSKGDAYERSIVGVEN